MSVQKILLLVALLIALFATFVTVPQAATILAVIGLVAGFWIVPDEHVRVIVSALALRAFNGTFGAIPEAGNYITAFIGYIAILAAGAALMIIFRNMYARVKP
jgi:hypothetical protein